MSPSGTRQRPDENRRHCVTILAGVSPFSCVGVSATVEGEESGNLSSDRPGRTPRVGLISLALADIYLTFHFMFPFCRAATGVRDENLNARALAGDGKLKEKRKPRPVVSLNFPAPAVQ